MFSCSDGLALYQLSWSHHMQINLQFFFCLGFASRTFTNHRTAREGGGHSINSSLPLRPALQILRHQPGDYCRELTSLHSQQPDSNWERYSRTTKLRALKQSALQCREAEWLLSSNIPHEEYGYETNNIASLNKEY